MSKNGLFPCSRFLGDIKEAYARNPNLTNLLLDPFFKDAINRCQVGKIPNIAFTLCHRNRGVLLSA